jgi:tRNA (cmo5U34)-methyltransferase
MRDGGRRDRLFAEPQPVGDFVFDEAVAEVFPDMIRRSVPGYAAIITMTRLLTRRYAQDGSRLYDLGCSLGASTAAMAQACRESPCAIVAVDNAPAMIQRARASLAESYPQIQWVCADIRDVAVRDASVVVLNFTLQFLPPADRLALLSRIHRGLRSGGILILSEKIAGEDAPADALLTDMHHAFKRANGYSELEISRKRTALEKVLLPETLDTHRARLQQAGFSRSDLWFQCFNFVSLVAFR